MKIPIVKNTVTNYLSMGVKLVQGILVTRWLISELGQEYYGLWTLLWSFFCYSLLLDFGFGVTAQKYTSTGLCRTDINKYNRIISTIFCFHCLMGLVIAVGTIIASFFIVELFHLEGATPAKVAFCHKGFLIFGLGSALIFPTGMFPEMLVGLQRIYLRNYLVIISKIAELFGILLLFSLNGNFITLVYFTLGLNAVVNIVMWMCLRRYIPHLRIRPWIHQTTFREIFHFSGFVYLRSIATLLWSKGSFLLISMFCGLVDLAYFRIGGRLPELMSQLTGPYQENISPLSAAFFARGKHTQLGKILINSMRWNSFLATGMMVGIFLYAQELLVVLFNYNNAQSVTISRWMVVSLYLTLVFRTIPLRFLMMAEHHKMVSVITMVESTSYVILCGVLLQYYPPVSVVIAALAIKLASLSLVIAPTMLKYLKVSVWEIIYRVSFKPMFATLPLIAETLLVKYFGKALSPLQSVIICIAWGAPTYLLAFYFLLDRNEQFFFKKKLNSFFSKTPTHSNQEHQEQN